MLFYNDLAEYVAKESEKLAELQKANIPDSGVVLDVLSPGEDQDRDGNPGRYSVTRPVDRLTIDQYGIAGDRHRSLTKRATGRESALYKSSGATIVNRRQIFAVSPEDCRVLSDRLGVEITPQLLGANLVIGRDDGAAFALSEVPCNTYFAIAQADAEAPPQPPIATLVNYVQQQGCSRTGKAIAQALDDPTLVRRFVTQAKTHRGIVCSVEYPADAPATIERGQRIFFRFPMGRCP
jgi:hypothetical protein